MPLRLRVIGNLFRVVGWLGVVWVVSEFLLRDHVMLPLDWLLILVGSGLLAGKRTSRRWATAWIAYWSVSMIASVVLGVMKPDELWLNLLTFHASGPVVLPWALGFAAVALAAYAWVLWLLWSAPVTEFIDRWEDYRRFMRQRQVEEYEARRSLPVEPALSTAVAAPSPADESPVRAVSRGRVAAVARLVQYGKTTSPADVEVALRDLEQLRESGRIDEDAYREYRDLLTDGRSSQLGPEALGPESPAIQSPEGGV